MKTVFSFILASVLLIACNNTRQTDSTEKNDKLPTDLINNPATASDQKGEEKGPAFKFDTETHDFGTIVEGEKVSYAFRFTNSGNADLLIRDAKGSCGCTVPEYPKTPISPGGEGVIKVTFNSEGKSGMQHKDVTIVANTTPNSKVLVIKGEVTPAKK